MFSEITFDTMSYEIVFMKFIVFGNEKLVLKSTLLQKRSTDPSKAATLSSKDAFDGFW